MGENSGLTALYFWIFLDQFNSPLRNLYEKDFRESIDDDYMPESRDEKRPYTPEESVEIVTMIRLDLYNAGMHCGAQAIRRQMEKDDLEPLPSLRTINRILNSHELTHRRTGKYDDDF